MGGEFNTHKLGQFAKDFYESMKDGTKSLSPISHGRYDVIPWQPWNVPLSVLTNNNIKSFQYKAPVNGRFKGFSIDPYSDYKQFLVWFDSSADPVVVSWDEVIKREFETVLLVPYPFPSFYNHGSIITDIASGMGAVSCFPTWANKASNVPYINRQIAAVRLWSVEPEVESFVARHISCYQDNISFASANANAIWQHMHMFSPGCKRVKIRGGSGDGDPGTATTDTMVLLLGIDGTSSSGNVSQYVELSGGPQIENESVIARCMVSSKRPNVKLQFWYDIENPGWNEFIVLCVTPNAGGADTTNRVYVALDAEW